MPQQLSYAEWSELFRESDPFKLAIRGRAALEGDIDAALNDAFTGGLPPELRGLQFPRRVALLIGLEIVPPFFASGVAAISEVRNRFAHGAIETLTPEDAQRLIDAWGEFLEKEVRALFLTEATANRRASCLADRRESSSGAVR